MCVNWNNPYKQCGSTWIKGNMHAHFAGLSPCAVIEQQDLIDAYRQKDYVFLGITNHLYSCDNELIATPSPIIVPGTEWNSRTINQGIKDLTYYDHYGIYSTNKDILTRCLAVKKPSQMLTICQNEPEAFTVMHHPNWSFPAHTPMESFMHFAPKVNALEIYNAGLEKEQGNAVATHNWDMLLGCGIAVLGIVGDDSHRLGDVGKAWLMVALESADNVTADTILASLIKGQFYSSTGVSFDSIQRNGDTLSIGTTEECRLRITTDFGSVVHEVKGKDIEWTFSEEYSYARVTAEGCYGAQAWTQPFFRK